MNIRSVNLSPESIRELKAIYARKFFPQAGNELSSYLMYQTMADIRDNLLTLVDFSSAERDEQKAFIKILLPLIIAIKKDDKFAIDNFQFISHKLLEEFNDNCEDFLLHGNTSELQLILDKFSFEDFREDVECVEEKKRTYHISKEQLEAASSSLDLKQANNVQDLLKKCQQEEAELILASNSLQAKRNKNADIESSISKQFASMYLRFFLNKPVNEIINNLPNIVSNREICKLINIHQDIREQLRAYPVNYDTLLNAFILVKFKSNDLSTFSFNDLHALRMSLVDLLLSPNLPPQLKNAIDKKQGEMDKFIDQRYAQASEGVEHVRTKHIVPTQMFENTPDMQTFRRQVSEFGVVTSKADEDDEFNKVYFEENSLITPYEFSISPLKSLKLPAISDVLGDILRTEGHVRSMPFFNRYFTNVFLGNQRFEINLNPIASENRNATILPQMPSIRRQWREAVQNNVTRNPYLQKIVNSSATQNFLAFLPATLLQAALTKKNITTTEEFLKKEQPIFKMTITAKEPDGVNFNLSYRYVDAKGIPILDLEANLIITYDGEKEPTEKYKIEVPHLKITSYNSAAKSIFSNTDNLGVLENAIAKIALTNPQRYVGDDLERIKSAKRNALRIAGQMLALRLSGNNFVKAINRIANKINSETIDSPFTRFETCALEEARACCNDELLDILVTSANPDTNKNAEIRDDILKGQLDQEIVQLAKRVCAKYLGSLSTAEFQSRLIAGLKNAASAPKNDRESVILLEFQKPRDQTTITFSNVFKDMTERERINFVDTAKRLTKGFTLTDNINAETIRDIYLPQCIIKALAQTCIDSQLYGAKNPDLILNRIVETLTSPKEKPLYTQLFGLKIRDFIKEIVGDLGKAETITEKSIDESISKVFVVNRLEFDRSHENTSVSTRAYHESLKYFGDVNKINELKSHVVESVIKPYNSKGKGRSERDFTLSKQDRGQEDVIVPIKVHEITSEAIRKRAQVITLSSDDEFLRHLIQNTLAVSSPDYLNVIKDYFDFITNYVGKRILPISTSWLGNEKLLKEIICQIKEYLVSTTLTNKDLNTKAVATQCATLIHKFIINKSLLADLAYTQNPRQFVTLDGQTNLSDPYKVIVLTQVPNLSDVIANNIAQTSIEDPEFTFAKIRNEAMRQVLSNGNDIALSKVSTVKGYGQIFIKSKQEEINKLFNNKEFQLMAKIEERVYVRSLEENNSLFGNAKAGNTFKPFYKHLVVMKRIASLNKLQLLRCEELYGKEHELTQLARKKYDASIPGDHAGSLTKYFISLNMTATDPEVVFYFYVQEQNRLAKEFVNKIKQNPKRIHSPSNHIVSEELQEKRANSEHKLLDSERDLANQIVAETNQYYYLETDSTLYSDTILTLFGLVNSRNTILPDFSKTWYDKIKNVCNDFRVNPTSKGVDEFIARLTDLYAEANQVAQSRSGIIRGLFLKDTLNTLYNVINRLKNKRIIQKQHQFTYETFVKNGPFYLSKETKTVSAQPLRAVSEQRMEPIKIEEDSPKDKERAVAIQAKLGFRNEKESSFASSYIALFKKKTDAAKVAQSHAELSVTKSIMKNATKPQT